MARESALRALSQVEGDIAFVPDIVEILADQRGLTMTRARAAEALSALRRYDEDRIFAAIHREMKGALDPELRRRLAYVLSGFGGRAVDATIVIAADLSSGQGLRRQSAVRALRAIGRPAHGFTPHLLPLLDDTDIAVVSEVIATLIAFDTEKERAARAALRLVKDDIYYGARAAAALRDLLPESAAFLDELRAVRESAEKLALDDSVRYFRSQLNETIRQLEAAARSSN